MWSRLTASEAEAGGTGFRRTHGHFGLGVAPRLTPLYRPVNAYPGCVRIWLLAVHGPANA